MNRIPPVRLPVATNAGVFLASYSASGLASLQFPPARKTARADAVVPRRVRPWHERTTQAVRTLLAGRAVKAWPPLDLSRGTDFQRAVWAALRRIARGETRTYGELARQLNRPDAARAVGRACGANPVPLLIPCHRVLATGGKLGGFSGGLKWKRRLLAAEGATRERAR